jgi:hypothetical protein
MKTVFLILLFLSINVSSQVMKEKKTIGRVEWVELPELKIKIRARIDTGAKTTSMHATSIEEITQQGQLLVKFQTLDNNGKAIELLRKVESFQKISNPGGFSSKRYVIKEKIKMGDFEKMVSVNLNDRSHMDFKLLVGRNVLLGRFVVDVARSHVLGD